MNVESDSVFRRMRSILNILRSRTSLYSLGSRASLISSELLAPAEPSGARSWNGKHASRSSMNQLFR